MPRQRVAVVVLALTMFVVDSSAGSASPGTDEPRWRHTVDGWEDAAYWQTETPKRTDGAPLEGAAVLACLCAVALLVAERSARHAPAVASAAPRSCRTATRPVLARE